MCIYTVKSQFFVKFKKSARGVHNSTERPKTRHLRRKGYTAKTNKDLGIYHVTYR